MEKKPNLFLRLIQIAFIIFLGLYIASESGYYEKTLKNKVTLTDEAIKQFEEDVKNGEVVDVNKYVVTEQKDYSNAFNRFGKKLEIATEEVVSNGINGLWNAIKMLFF